MPIKNVKFIDKDNDSPNIIQEDEFIEVVNNVKEVATLPSYRDHLVGIKDKTS